MTVNIPKKKNANLKTEERTETNLVTKEQINAAVVPNDAPKLR